MGALIMKNHEEDNEEVQLIRIKGIWKYWYSPYEKRVFYVYRITEIIPMNDP